ncbi:MAG: photoactive yellow protein [Planctomycetaceae bacterium]|jgi:photoactive yellow protein|nr:photoactive yellow protein [Planctomycetaceae bacterium]
MSTMTVVKFSDKDLDNAMSKMNAAQLDKLAFGAVQLDKNGTILQYNAADGAIVGRDPKSVIGKNFFNDVAPCTKSPAFYGKFIEGTRSGILNTQFEYLFNYNMKPTQVKVHMKKSLTDDTYWVFVKRI